MSLLDGILGQLSSNPTVDSLAAKVGLTPEQVEQAVAALGHAHHQPGDTTEQASQQTGLPQDKVREIVGHLGGEGALGPIAVMLREQGAPAGSPGRCRNFCSGPPASIARRERDDMETPVGAVADLFLELNRERFMGEARRLTRGGLRTASLFLLAFE